MTLISKVVEENKLSLFDRLQKHCKLMSLKHHNTVSKLIQTQNPNTPNRKHVNMEQRKIMGLWSQFFSLFIFPSALESNSQHHEVW